jgi:hypothetical protein
MIPKPACGSGRLCAQAYGNVSSEASGVGRRMTCPVFP